MWVYINKDNLDEYLSQYGDLAEDFKFYNLIETKDAIFLPRLFTKNYPSDKLVIHKGQKQVEPEKVNFTFTGTLRKNQEPIIANVMAEYKKHGTVNGIIKARPGIGKTVMSVYIAAKLGLKPCIIVDQENLMKQWIKAFLDFTDLTIEDIGIGKQKVFNTDKKVCIFMVQSLLSKIKKDLTSAFEIVDAGRFGIVFYDEVHSTSASEKFAKSTVLFRTLNIIGLSATPFHHGPAEILMKNTIGEIIAESNDYDLEPEFRLVYYNSGMNKYYGAMSKIQDYLYKKAYYNSMIAKSPKYIELITDITKKLGKDGHRTMILCFTEKQVKAISEEFDRQNIKHIQYYGKEREIDYSEDILVSTYSFAAKGFDYKELSAMILACPLSGKKSLIQSCGRVVRSCDGKITPVIVSLVDLCFPTLFVPEIQKQKKIIKDEFKCTITEEKWGLDE